MVCNPDRLEYGDHSAEIIDFGVFDQNDILTNTISKGDICTIRMKVQFRQEIRDPIFAFSIKNKLGIEISGTNTILSIVRFAARQASMSLAEMNTLPSSLMSIFAPVSAQIF